MIFPIIFIQIYFDLLITFIVIYCTFYRYYQYHLKKNSYIFLYKYIKTIKMLY